MSSGDCEIAGSTPPYRSDSLLTLLERVHGSLRLDVLADRYIAGVARLVRADGYAFYIFDPETRRPTRLAERGGVEPYMTRFVRESRRRSPGGARLLRAGSRIDNRGSVF